MASATREERDKGWFRGRSRAEVPPDTPISRRFGLKQRDKVRLIFVFSGSGVDSAVGVQEFLCMHTAGFTCSLTQYLVSAKVGAPTPTELVGKTFDLPHAYRQIVSHVLVFSGPKLESQPFSKQRSCLGAVRSFATSCGQLSMTASYSWPSRAWQRALKELQCCFSRSVAGLSSRRDWSTVC